MSAVLSNSSSTINIEGGLLKELTGLVADSFREVASDSRLRLPQSQIIRAGRAGGLPFDGLTSDLFLGCLPSSQICYGNCFAAKEAFQAGFDFTRRVPNILDEKVLRQDLSKISNHQGFVRNGWNSDPSWDWELATKVGELVSEAGKHPVFLTKAFRAPDDAQYNRLANMGAELRVCVSAFDTDAQLAYRLQTILDFRRAGGIAIPVVMTAYFKQDALMSRQNRIVDNLLGHDLPAAENSIRFNPQSPVIQAINIGVCSPVSGSADLWAGRIYPDKLIVPTLSSVPEHYRGVKPYRSDNDPSYLETLFADPVPPHDEVRRGTIKGKPACAGVPIVWHTNGQSSAPNTLG